ncbi:MAG: Ku protein [Myxococcota bacterium]|nr:Ku protein [Myxococcota bacterium]
MARAIWSGAINFGLVTIPVKLYSAIHEHEVHFHYLHKPDQGRIRNERVCGIEGKPVDWNDIVRGYEFEKGQYVLLDDDDLKKASPEASQSVDIVQFVHQSEIDPILFDTPYYLEPEKKGRHAYALLRETLRETGKVAIARVVMRTREHLAAVQPDGNALVLEMLHWADEIVSPTELDLPAKTEKLAAAETKMAAMLVDSMTGKFVAADFADRYRDELMALIDARIQGRPAPRTSGKRRGPTNVVDLLDVLKRSLAHSKKGATTVARKPAPQPRGKRGSGRRKHAA